MHRKQSGKNIHQIVNSVLLEAVELFIFSAFQLVSTRTGKVAGEWERKDSTAIGNVIYHKLSGLT